MRDAIYRQVRGEFADELAATTEHWALAAVEKKMHTCTMIIGPPF